MCTYLMPIMYSYIVLAYVTPRTKTCGNPAGLATGYRALRDLIKFCWQVKCKARAILMLLSLLLPSLNICHYLLHFHPHSISIFHFPFSLDNRSPFHFVAY